jgi:hypothetical protein
MEEQWVKVVVCGWWCWCGYREKERKNVNGDGGGLRWRMNDDEDDEWGFYNHSWISHYTLGISRIFS